MSSEESNKDDDKMVDNTTNDDKDDKDDKIKMEPEEPTPTPSDPAAADPAAADAVEPSTVAAAAVPAEVPATATTTTAERPSKKRPRSPETEVTAAVSAASAAAAAQLSATMGWNGLYSLLSATAMTSAANLPTLEQVQQAAQKSVAECPPFCHLSKTDSAPQLKLTVDERRLHVKGGMRGYRMSRLTHGISQGHYYYETLLLDPPPVSEIVQALPSNVRMGPKLQEQLQQALTDEKAGHATTFGGHVRLGVSMRTGDLQAPVGYDKWSFAIRDIGGSKIHCSRREDAWGGEAFGPGDVIGCAISLPKKNGNTTTNNSNSTTANNSSSSSDTPNPNPNPNEMRFFKNGQPMGEFVISKGKREGGVAFSIPDGVYYPAVSLYMGAAVQVNPGPHFICPPKKLPAGLKLLPVSDLCKPLITVEEAIVKVQKEKVFRKPDMMLKFQELVQAEVQVLQDAYTSHRRKHVQEVAQEREKRNLKMDDLEEDELYEKKMES
jgi:Set1/Ash2 histone methyltransferase complex subunit ASH2